MANQRLKAYGQGRQQLLEPGVAAVQVFECHACSKRRDVSEASAPAAIEVLQVSQCRKGGQGFTSEEPGDPSQAGARGQGRKVGHMAPMEVDSPQPRAAGPKRPCALLLSLP